MKADNSGDEDPRRAAILKLSDFAAEARALVLDARKTAARIVADARAKLEEEQRQASETGYADGFARGREEGYAEGLRQAREDNPAPTPPARLDLDALAARIAEASSSSMASDVTAREVVELAVKLAEKVIGRVAGADLRAARANLVKALKLARRQLELTVLVHPDQLAGLQEHLPSLTQALAVAGQIRWAADESVSPGGVKVLTRRGQVDATIRTQWDNVTEALLGARAPSPGRASPPGGAGTGQYVPQFPNELARGVEADEEPDEEPAGRLIQGLTRGTAQGTAPRGTDE